KPIEITLHPKVPPEVIHLTCRPSSSARCSMVGVQPALRLTMIVSSDPNIRTFCLVVPAFRLPCSNVRIAWARSVGAGNERMRHQTGTADTHGARGWLAWSDGERQERFRTPPTAPQAAVG